MNGKGVTRDKPRYKVAVHITLQCIGIKLSSRQHSQHANFKFNCQPIFDRIYTQFQPHNFY
jgi:hypothetical protein